MTRTDRIWKHADEAFAHADNAFRSADKAFAEAENLPHGTRTKTQQAHHLRFTSRNWHERWKLTCKFFGLGWRTLFTGKAVFHFRERP